MSLASIFFPVNLFVEESSFHKNSETIMLILLPRALKHRLLARYRRVNGYSSSKKIVHLGTIQERSRVLTKMRSTETTSVNLGKGEHSYGLNVEIF
jgi:hypothetical protein